MDFKTGVPVSGVKGTFLGAGTVAYSKHIQQAELTKTNLVIHFTKKIGKPG